jgi:hypothetical protein
VTAEDDPEARIRELERSLNDQARASELGGAQASNSAYLPPPTAPYTESTYNPPTYTAPTYGNQAWGTPSYGQLPTPTRQSSAGIPWAVFIVIAVVFLVAVGVGAVIWSTKSAVKSSHISGGGASTGIPTVPGMPAAPSTRDTDPDVLAGVPGQDLTVSGIDENKTIACNDANVSVSGIRNTVNITGHCVKISVSGMNNVVTVDAADAIGASGFDNRVTFHSGSPQIDAMGSNVVEQG